MNHTRITTVAIKTYILALICEATDEGVDGSVLGVADFERAEVSVRGNGFRG